MKAPRCSEEREASPSLAPVIQQALEQGTPLDFDRDYLPFIQHRVLVQGEEDRFDLYVSYQGSTTLFYRDTAGKVQPPVTAAAGASFPEHLQSALENAFHQDQTAFAEPVANRRSASRRLVGQTISLQTA